MDEDFSDRARRIRDQRGSDAIGPEERRRTGVIRPFWLLFGTLWGLWAIVHVKIVNQNYDALKAQSEADPEIGARVLLMMLYGLGSLAALAILVIVGLLFARRSAGLWNLVIGMAFVGIAIGSLLTPILAPIFIGPQFLP